MKIVTSINIRIGDISIPHIKRMKTLFRSMGLPIQVRCHEWNEGYYTALNINLNRAINLTFTSDETSDKSALPKPYKSKNY